MPDSRRTSDVEKKESSPEMEVAESEPEEDEDEEKKAERIARRMAREISMLEAKLTKLKDKEVAAKAERKSLKEAMKKNHELLK
jgi:hypothetical protein